MDRSARKESARARSFRWRRRLPTRFTTRSECASRICPSKQKRFIWHWRIKKRIYERVPGERGRDVGCSYRGDIVCCCVPVCWLQFGSFRKTGGTASAPGNRDCPPAQGNQRSFGWTKGSGSKIAGLQSRVSRVFREGSDQQRPRASDRSLSRGTRHLSG